MSARTILDPEQWVTRTRIRLQLKFAWLTEAILTLEPMEAPEPVRVLIMDPVNAPAATDGKRFYYHPERFRALCENDALFIYLHEVLHLTLKHPWRMKGRDRELWNFVTDALVNSLIIKLRAADGFTFTPVPSGIYLPSGFEDTFAEKLYDMLAKAINDAAGEGEGGEGDDKDGSGEPGESQGKLYKLPVPGEFRGWRRSIEGRLVTPHDMWEDVLSEPDGKTRWDNISVRMQGYMPVGIGLDAELGARVRVPWYRELYMHVKEQVPFDYSRRYRWIRSKGLTYGIQRLESPKPRFVLAWDLSGSISKPQRNRMATESMGIIRTFDNYEILMLGCDAAVHGYWYLHPGEDLPMDELKGGGGTSFVPVFDKIKELGFYPDCLIFFTDSFGTFPENPPDYPVIWAVVGVQGEVPWGKYLEVILDD